MTKVRLDMQEEVPQVFRLRRVDDVTGISGTGIVVWGVRFPDEVTVCRWNTDSPSTVIWESIDALMTVSGHDGATRLEWLIDGHWKEDG